MNIKIYPLCHGGPPDNKGQHTNCGSIWYTIDDGPFIRSEFVSKFQTQNYLRELYEEAVFSTEYI